MWDVLWNALTCCGRYLSVFSSVCYCVCCNRTVRMERTKESYRDWDRIWWRANFFNSSDRSLTEVPEFFSPKRPNIIVTALIIITITVINFTIVKNQEAVYFCGLNSRQYCRLCFCQSSFVHGINDYKSYHCFTPTTFFLSPPVHCISYFLLLI